MPIYEYRCEQGHTFEVMQRMADDPVASCQTCEAPVQRVFHPVAVHFKGSGFYNTDYGKRRRGESSDGAQGESDGAKAGDGGDKKAKDSSGGGSDGGKSAATTSGGSGSTGSASGSSGSSSSDSS